MLWIRKPTRPSLTDESLVAQNRKKSMNKIEKEETRLEGEAADPEAREAEDSVESESATPAGEEVPESTDDTLPGEEAEAEDVGLEEPMLDEQETLQADLDQLKDQHLRLAADFENYRKRVSGELTSSWVRAQADLAQTLLEGLDDLQRVSQFTSEDTTLDSLIEGVDLVERKLMKALTNAGLEVFDPVGEIFDPNRMEAVMRVPPEEPEQDGTVHQVFQKGYLFKEQLLRVARVSVYMGDD